MPVQSWGHGQYWNKDDGLVAPVAPEVPGYPAYQSGILYEHLGSGFGGFQTLWDRIVALCARWWRLFRPHQIPLWMTQAHSPRPLDLMRKLDDEQQQVVHEVLKQLTSDDWETARDAVRDTAKTLRFNRPESWVPYSRALKADHRRAENLFRHIRAAEQLKGVTNPTRNLLTELAYCGFERFPDSES